jgi:hypothetical protein
MILTVGFHTKRRGALKSGSVFGRRQHRETFERAVDRFGTFESYAEYAIRALAMGDAATAARLQSEIDKITTRWNNMNRELNDPVMRRLKAAHALARRDA